MSSPTNNLMGPPPVPSQRGHAHSSSQSSTSYHPHHAHTRSSSNSNNFLQSSLPLLPATSPANTTRILKFSNFDPLLKTRDIHHIFNEWEDDRGGFKIKWADDVSCWIVFNDPIAAKRAYLTLLGTLPPGLKPTPEFTPSLTPYSGPEVQQIITAVQNRPRSRSNAGSINGGGGGGGGGHSRKSSLMGSGGGAAFEGTSGYGGHHHRSNSFGSSLGGSPKKPIVRNGETTDGTTVGGRETTPPPPVPTIPDHLIGNGVIESELSFSSSSPSKTGDRTSPEIVRRGLNESPRSHRKSESRAGVDLVANAVEGMTIAEEGTRA